jgi:hypothetical protein
MVDFLDFGFYIKEHLGEILFLLGVVLLVIYFSTINTFGTVLSAASFFFGFPCVVFGVFVKLGVFSVKFRSLDGASVILICCSVVLFAFSISILEFLTTSVGFDIFAFRYKIYYVLVFDSRRPYLLVSNVSLLFALGLFLCGLLLKVYSILRY